MATDAQLRALERARAARAAKAAGEGGDVIIIEAPIEQRRRTMAIALSTMLAGALIWYWFERPAKASKPPEPKPDEPKPPEPKPDEPKPPQPKPDEPKPPEPKPDEPKPPEPKPPECPTIPLLGPEARQAVRAVIAEKAQKGLEDPSFNPPLDSAAGKYKIGTKDYYAAAMYTRYLWVYDAQQKAGGAIVKEAIDAGFWEGKCPAPKWIQEDISKIPPTQKPEPKPDEPKPPEPKPPEPKPPQPKPQELCPILPEPNKVIRDAFFNTTENYIKAGEPDPTFTGKWVDYKDKKQYYVDALTERHAKHALGFAWLVQWPKGCLPVQAWLTNELARVKTAYDEHQGP
jgi:hypothetical protein